MERRTGALATLRGLIGVLFYGPCPPKAKLLLPGTDIGVVSYIADAPRIPYFISVRSTV